MKMSRWETAQEIVGSVLNGRANELTINIENDVKATVFFNMAYWRDEDHKNLLEELIERAFWVTSWTIHGAIEGLQLEFVLMDPAKALEKGAELELAGVLNVGWTKKDILEKYISGDF